MRSSSSVIYSVEGRASGDSELGHWLLVFGGIWIAVFYLIAYESA